MKDTEEKRVPIAYVTKWVGYIMVMRDVGLSNKPDCLWTGWQIIAPADWTTDKTVAEERYRKNLERKKANLKKTINKIDAQLKDAPVYEEHK